MACTAQADAPNQSRARAASVYIVVGLRPQRQGSCHRGRLCGMLGTRLLMCACMGPSTSQPPRPRPHRKGSTHCTLHLACSQQSKTSLAAEHKKEGKGKCGAINKTEPGRKAAAAPLGSCAGPWLRPRLGCWWWAAAGGSMVGKGGKSTKQTSACGCGCGGSTDGKPTPLLPVSRRACTEACKTLAPHSTPRWPATRSTWC